jgi:hypothetical protein
MTKVYVIGYPGDMGGANTECWHTTKLWRRNGVDVHFIPTCGVDRKWKIKLDEIGCVTHEIQIDHLENVPDLRNAITVGFCNGYYIDLVPRLRTIGCKIVWLNCMTFLFDNERQCFKKNGTPDAMIYQSEFQRSELERDLYPFGYESSQGYLIHGAFEIGDWKFEPLQHGENEPFVIGRAARPDCDKWSSNTWKIYENIQYWNKKGIMLGVNNRTLEKLGTPPDWISCLRPTAIRAELFYSLLHCLLPVNGGARENWPRAGLEAFATGVPVVAQNDWGWKEMIEHGQTGFLGSNDQELAHYTAVLAHDEKLRQQIIQNAYEKLLRELASPEKIWNAWEIVFRNLS